MEQSEDDTTERIPVAAFSGEERVGGPVARHGRATRDAFDDLPVDAIRELLGDVQSGERSRPTRSPNPGKAVLGKVLKGRYQIRGVLGHGGFAAVYEARDLELERVVAVKVLRLQDESKPEGWEERFLREARAAAQISHPDVVQIFDYGMTRGGEPFIVLERLRGHTLERELARGGPMEAARAVHLMVRALDALSAAHALGIVHRDLKPSNLFLVFPGTRTETLRVLDFGLAFMLDQPEGQGRLTRTGNHVGTPQYFAPEYLTHKKVTPAFDVYQMGLVFVEMLSGRMVVDYDNPYQCALAHVRGGLDVSAELLASALGPVVRRALARDPSLRFADAAQFRDALEQISLVDRVSVAIKTSAVHSADLSARTKPYAELAFAPTDRAFDPEPAAHRAIHTPVAPLATGGAGVASASSPPITSGRAASAKRAGRAALFGAIGGAVVAAGIAAAAVVWVTGHDRGAAAERGGARDAVHQASHPSAGSRAGAWLVEPTAPAQPATPAPALAAVAPAASPVVVEIGPPTVAERALEAAPPANARRAASPASRRHRAPAQRRVPAAAVSAPGAPSNAPSAPAVAPAPAPAPRLPFFE